MERYRAELEEELNNEHTGLTVGEYARSFQEARVAAAELSPLSLERDEIEIGRIENLFGRTPIVELSTAQIKEGYEGFNFHELRHTQATLLIGQGADIKTVQNRLGHSSASLTMDIYAHAIEQNDREAADAIGDLLSS